MGKTKIKIKGNDASNSKKMNKKESMEVEMASLKVEKE